MAGKGVDFKALSDSEQREVAERLLKIEQSGWKPFWCPVATCDGEPHWLEVREADGGLVNTFVALEDTEGPNGEPVGEPVDSNGMRIWPDELEEAVKQGLVLGRPVLDAKWAHQHARMDQRLLGWKKPWTLYLSSGRGTGKTRTGVEFIHLCHRRGVDTAILGRRGTEIMNTHVATILATAHPEFKPEYFASKDILVWPNGTTTYLFSAEKPENIRSVNVGACWCDEAAFMPEIETAWMNLKLATRIETPGNPIHILITSTPTSTPWVIKMHDDPDVTVRRVSTYANRANLSADFLRALEKEYEGTRMGRQELHGEVLRDVEGSLWNDDMFQHLSVADAQAFEDLVDSMDDRVLAVDPAGSKGKRSDATGIIGGGRQDDGGGNSRYYVMIDATLKGSPNEWAEQVFKAARLIKANRVVVERNFGADMVKNTLMDYAKLHPEEACDDSGMDFRITESRAVKGKETRAEPVVALYEQARVLHCPSAVTFGDLSMLEKEQVNWVPKSRGGKFPSPNRVDALVWMVMELKTSLTYAAGMAIGRDVMSKLKAKPPSINGYGAGVNGASTPLML